jgi:hypothetical protein
MRNHLILAAFALLFLSTPAASADAVTHAALATALNSIQEPDLKHHVQTLADDTFEGREAGSRGGRAAGIYLGKEFQEHRLAGAGSQGYYQSFGGGYRNILARLEGSDPAVRDEVVMVSAHYDHVGYGNAQNSYGPTGYIHNGADDNASGVAGLLEMIEALTLLPTPPRRTIVFAFWDGEEKGLLGSKHWVSSPTIPLSQVVCLVNMDMIGRLTNNKVEVYGTRTAPGLRRLVALGNRESDLRLDCTWEMIDNSDHFPFYERGIPILMLHTGLHGDYHRPSDDVERVQFAGMQRVSRLLFQTVYELANRPDRTRFRQRSRGEGVPAQQQIERPLSALAGRLGVRFDPTADALAGVKVTGVDEDAPADRGGMRAGDRIIEFAGTRVSDVPTLRKLVWAAESPTTALVTRQGIAEPLPLKLQLIGSPVRLGITWREDDAEPGAIIVTRVVDGTAASVAGMTANDRIYEVNGQSFADTAEFRKLIAESQGTAVLTVDRGGQIRSATVEMPGRQPAADAAARRLPGNRRG